MQDLLEKVTRPVALSDHAVRGLAQIRATRRDYVDAHAAEPTTAELAAATGFTRAQLESLLAVERTPRGLDEPLGEDDEGGPTTLGDMIADPEAEDDYQHVLDAMGYEILPAGSTSASARCSGAITDSTAPRSR